MSDPRFVGVLSLAAGSRPIGEPGGTMILNDDFSFIDSRDVTWIAHKGDIIDGASIPKIFKRIIGGSFRSSYLPAAVLHDVYCASKSRPQKDTSRMFYQAMITNEVNPLKAWLMYEAVYRFGPQW